MTLALRPLPADGVTGQLNVSRAGTGTGGGRHFTPSCASCVGELGMSGKETKFRLFKTTMECLVSQFEIWEVVS